MSSDPAFCVGNDGTGAASSRGASTCIWWKDRVVTIHVATRALVDSRHATCRFPQFQFDVVWHVPPVRGNSGNSMRPVKQIWCRVGSWNTDRQCIRYGAQVVVRCSALFQYRCRWDHCGPRWVHPYQLRLDQTGQAQSEGTRQSLGPL
jgi:hypothetical protein